MKKLMYYIDFTNSVFITAHGLALIFIFVLLNIMWQFFIVNAKFTFRTSCRILINSICVTYCAIFMFAAALERNFVYYLIGLFIIIAVVFGRRITIESRSKNK